MMKVCVVTGTRAEYGLLRWVMEGIKNSSSLQLQVIATGMHLSPEFGLTYQEVEADGFDIDSKVEMLLSSDSSVGISKSMGLGVIGFADAFSQLKPDTLLVLGDRYEIFAAASAAMIACIPIVHLHGGETTEGAFDEAIRHSITKMAYLHFVAAEEYRQRVIQLGESPDRVFQVGGLGIDNIVKMKFLDRKSFEESIDFRLAERNLLITFHPVTLEKGAAKEQMQELFQALDKLENTNFIFTMPNSDTEGRALVQMVNDYVQSRSHAVAFTSLGQLRYLSAIAHVDAVVGNSSSGLIEVPSFRKPTINIGDRQLGRLKAESVIDCEPERDDILTALTKAFSGEFQDTVKNVVNPYGNGGASEKIVEMLENMRSVDFLKKTFFDLPVVQL